MMTWQDLLQSSILAAIIVAAAVAIGLMLGRLMNRLQQRHALPKSLVMPLRIFLRYGLVLVAFLLVLTAYRVNIGNFWTLISAILGLIAIGFVAVWSMLSNVSATFLILIFKPFRMGDKIEIVGDGVRGAIDDLNIIYTTLLAEDGSLVRVPNNLFFQKMTRINPADPSPGSVVGTAESLAGALQPDHSQANLAGIKGWSPSGGKSAGPAPRAG